MATHDVLSIVAQFSKRQKRIVAADIHLLAYCAFLASHLSGGASSNWEYSFTSTPLGAPFAMDISLALDLSAQRGFIVIEQSNVRITEDGQLAQRGLATLRNHERRTPYIAAACDSTVMIPLPVLRELVFLEPQLRFARGKTKKLMDDLGLGLFTPQAEAVQSALVSAKTEDAPRSPLLALLVWLDYLRQSESGGKLVG